MKSPTEKGGDAECTTPSCGTNKRPGWLDRKVFTGEFEDIWIDVGLFGAGLLIAYFLAFSPV